MSSKREKQIKIEVDDIPMYDKVDVDEMSEEEKDIEESKEENLQELDKQLPPIEESDSEDESDSFDSTLKGLLTSEEKSEPLQALEILMDGTKNLDLKTEINHPFQFSALSTYRDYIESRNFPKASKRLSDFLTTTCKFLISNKRKGRTEFVDAIKQVIGGGSISDKELRV